MDFVMKVLHCEAEVTESETLMAFLADDKVSDNEAIVPPAKLQLMQKNALLPYRTDWTNKGKDVVRKVEKDPDELSQYDRIYLELFFNLDHYWKARMRGLELRRNFAGSYDDFRKKLGVIQEAGHGLRQSTNLRELLDVAFLWEVTDGRSY
jgi:cytokinesis protein